MLSLDKLVVMETGIVLYLMKLLVTDATCTTLFKNVILQGKMAVIMSITLSASPLLCIENATTF